MNRWITGTFIRCRSCAAANRPPSRSCGVEFASFGDNDARSIRTSLYTVAAVSIVR